jgi:hypothetical protein
LKRATIPVSAESGLTYSYSIKDAMSDGDVKGLRLYSYPDGQDCIDVFRLASHFRNGQLIYRYAEL